MFKALDDLDVKIIIELQRDGRMSISELAENVESSRLTVSKRLRRLIDNKFIIIRGGLNAKKMDFQLACVGLEVKSDLGRKEVECRLIGCPRVLNIFRTIEKANFHLAVWGEDDQTIKSTIESFREIPDADLIYCHYLGSPIHGELPINIHLKNQDVAPCGKTCSDCYRYINEWCLGCPATNYYRNTL